MAEATADAHNPDLARYAADKALADERSTLTVMNRSGIVMKGSPTLNPRVTSTVAGDTPAVTITDCVDLTHWVPVYRATGKSAAAPNQLPRVVATALARPYDGSWRIMSITTDRTRSC